MEEHTRTYEVVMPKKKKKKLKLTKLLTTNKGRMENGGTQ